MAVIVTHLASGGRLVIPAELRERLGLKVGDALTLRIEGDELRITTRRAGLRRAQDIVARHGKDDPKSWAEELIEERRAESSDE